MYQVKTHMFETDRIVAKVVLELLTDAAPGSEIWLCNSIQDDSSDECSSRDSADEKSEATAER